MRTGALLPILFKEGWLSEYYEQFYTNKVDNQDEVEKFLEI